MSTLERHTPYGAGRSSVAATIRRLAGLSQREVAEAAGIARETVNAIESGRQRPRPRTAEAIALALGYDDVAQVFPPSEDAAA